MNSSFTIFRLFALFLVIISVKSPAQTAWQPFDPAIKTLFQTQTDSSIRAVWVDSTTENGQVWHLNRVPLVCDTCIHLYPVYFNQSYCGRAPEPFDTFRYALLNQPLFWGRTARKISPKIWEFIWQDTLWLQWPDFVGQTWIGKSNGDSAKTINEQFVTGTGQVDTIRTVVYSESDTVWLSYLKGVIGFTERYGKGRKFARMNNPSPYSLAEINKFKVGDVFYYKSNYYSQFDVSNTMSNKKITFRRL